MPAYISFICFSSAKFQQFSFHFEDYIYKDPPWTFAFFFFYLSFLSRVFTIHRTAAERGGYLFISFLPLPLALLQRAHLSVSSIRSDLVVEDLNSALFFYNSEPRPDTTVVGLSSEDIVSLSVQDLKQRTRTRKHLEFSCQSGKYRPKT